MARIRTIKPEFWLNEDLNALPESTHLLAAALLNYADDEGYFNANPGLIKAACCPLREPSVSVHDSLSQLAGIGYLRLGSAGDGKRYGHITKFKEHQVINRASDSKIKENPISWDSSLNTHGAISEDSSGKGKERKGKEGNGEGREGAPADFAFVGKIIRLKVKDFDRWRKTYTAIPDFLAALGLADDYYSENPPADGKWFFPVSRWLEKENAKASETRRKEDDIYRVVDSAPPSPEEREVWRAKGYS